MVCKISEIIKPEWIFPDLKSVGKNEALKEIAQNISSQISVINPLELANKLIEREQKASTGADLGLAIPHATLAAAPTLIVTLSRSSKGIDFGALDSGLSHLFFTVISPAKTGLIYASHLQAISSICRLMRSSNLISSLLLANNASDMFSLLIAEEKIREGKSS